MKVALLVHAVNVFSQFLFCGARCQGDVSGPNTQPFTGADFGIDVDMGRWVVADDDDSQVRLDAIVHEALNANEEVRFNGGCTSFTVHALGWHNGVERCALLERSVVLRDITAAS